jgi:hypothetical protein
VAAFLTAISPALVAVVLLGPGPAAAADASDSAAETAAQRGYQYLTTKSYIPVAHDQEVFDNLWRLWEEPLRSQAAKATVEERRHMAFSRYGLTASPDHAGPVPMQYVDAGHGGWSINCLACHGGKVLGRAIPGLPNSHFAMQTFTDEVRSLKVKQGKLSAIELATAPFPMGNSNGTTNAVMFGVALGFLRDENLNMRVPDAAPEFVHHDMDAPPWWNVKKKTYLYIDGFAPKSHRALMQFLLVPQNDAAKFQAWEDDFKDLYAWIESLEPPKYPWPLNQDLASQGRVLFEQTCSRCHGTYGEQWTYPNKLVPIDEVGTDRVRLDALSPIQRAGYELSWFGQLDDKKVIPDPGGYVAPPLDGIWASAPYLHNGAVPTLWHLFHADNRPVVWQRSEDGYDADKVGLEVTTMDGLPAGTTDPKQKRRYFDTRLFGKSSQGHTFPEEFNEAEKQAVIEYLKTL